MTKKKEYFSMIQASLHVSESEIAALYPDYEYNWFDNDIEKLKSILFDLGLDTAQYFEYQTATQHRNRINKIVTCGRFYGSERSDTDWLNSGYASAAAKDKSRNSRLTDDLYRMKALTIDTQLALEARDKYNVIEEEQEGEE